jgi:hypothetical protein
MYLKIIKKEKDMADIKLRLVNQSQDVNNTRYVIFQKNVAENFDELAIAWRVVKNLGIGDYHPFTYPVDFYVSAGDAWGNHMPQQLAANGQMWEVKRERSGDRLVVSPTPADSQTEVEVKNSLPMGAISADIYRDGKLLATKTNVSPEQKAVFQFQPRLFIGAVSQIEEGQVMHSAILQNINTEIDLLGIVKADIVITGGGGGPQAQPFQFTLSRINMV